LAHAFGIQSKILPKAIKTQGEEHSKEVHRIHFNYPEESREVA